MNRIVYMNLLIINRQGFSLQLKLESYKYLYIRVITENFGRMRVVGEGT